MLAAGLVPLFALVIAWSLHARLRRLITDQGSPCQRGHRLPWWKCRLTMTGVPHGRMLLHRPAVQTPVSRPMHWLALPSGLTMHGLALPSGLTMHGLALPRCLTTGGSQIRRARLPARRLPLLDGAMTAAGAGVSLLLRGPAVPAACRGLAVSRLPPRPGTDTAKQRL